MSAPDPRNDDSETALAAQMRLLATYPREHVTHVTETGLAICANRLFPRGASRSRAAVRSRMRRLGLRVDTVACDGTPSGGRYARDVIMSAFTASKVPTCPRCAVLRDAALEGKLP